VPVDPSPGIPSGFIALFVIVALVGIGMAIWRAVVLSRSGLNPLVAREQLEARLAQSLSQQNPAPPAPPAPAQQEKSIEERLAELNDLHDRGVISDEERAAGRAKIIGGE
jgi:hypothetical protein